MAEETYDRLVLAKGQLDTALDLFLDQKNYSSAITLAGAAEEIFGHALAPVSYTHLTLPTSDLV